MNVLNERDLINLIKDNTGFKGEGSCIDLILLIERFRLQTLLLSKQT